MENNKYNAKEWFVKSDYQYKLDDHDEGGFLGIDEDVVAEMLDEYHKFNVMGLLEEVTKGTLSKNDMLRILLLLYGVTERYFYHDSYIAPSGEIFSTNELIECTKDSYDIIKADKYSEHHKPVKYISNNIPTNKKLREILYAR
jgi:hypothetical protein